MQMQMTEKDKKLIVFLAIFVILVAGGYWGIYPVVSNIFSVQEQIEDEKALQDMNMVLRLKHVQILFQVDLRE